MNWLVYEKFVKWVKFNDEFECDNKYNDVWWAKWKLKLCHFTKVVGAWRSSGVRFWRVLPAPWVRRVELLTVLKEGALIVVRYLSSIDVVAAEVGAVFPTWWWNHDVEEVFSGPTVHYGIQKPLEGHCDGLHKHMSRLYKQYHGTVPSCLPVSYMGMWYIGGLLFKQCSTQPI